MSGFIQLYKYYIKVFFAMSNVLFLIDDYKQQAHRGNAGGLESQAFCLTDDRAYVGVWGAQWR
jgi:hypothetical protein